MSHVSTCVVCGAATDAFLCGDARSESGCLGLLLQRLGDCAWLEEQLDVTLSKQDKVGGSSVGFVTGTGEKALPIKLNASDATANLRNELFTQVRDLWECYGIHDDEGRPTSLDVEPTITATSRWLMRHPSWISLNPAADEIFTKLTDAIHWAKRVVDIPKDNRIFVGKCGFEMNGVVCTYELHTRPRATEVTCPLCGSEWIVEERLEWLRTIAEDMELKVPALSRLLTSLGFEKATEEAIQAKAKAGLIVRTERDRHGRSSFRVGDVMDAFMTGEPQQAA